MVLTFKSRTKRFCNNFGIRNDGRAIKGSKDSSTYSHTDIIE
jgi:hypothetical protein